VKFRRELPVAAGDCWGFPFWGIQIVTELMGAQQGMGKVFSMAMPMQGIGLKYCRRFVDHYISSNDGLVIRLGCSNSHAVGAR
jgi:hypothetical protein